MRLTCLLIFFASISLVQLKAQGNKKIDVLHYKFEITVSDKNDIIEGRAFIDFIALDNSSTVSFDLAGLDKEGKGMQVSEVIWDPRGGAKPLINVPFVHAGNRLSIEPKKPLQRGNTYCVSIRYAGIPSDGLIISKNKFGHRTFFSDNWPNRAHQWIPCNDDPADKATVETWVRAPSHYEVVSNGIEKATTIVGTEKYTQWLETTPLPTKVIVIGVADFAISLADSVSGIPVTSWVFPENAKEGFKDYAPAAPILSFFIDYIGPYPYKKLANVQSKTIFGGMENASAIFYFENSVNGKQDQQSLIAHEIAHQWFGNMATEKSFAHLWLSEGFATYMAILYAEKSSGAGKAKSMREEDRLQVISFLKRWDKPVVDSVSPYMELLNANSYQKGGWVLHMLRRQLGDSVFRQCIRSYYAAYAGKNADTRDLQHVFERVSGKNLGEFFNQWLYTPGIPKLDIKWGYNAAEQKLNVSIVQLQKSAFKFPIELSIETSLANKRETLQVTEANQTFSISLNAKPKELKADPEINLLFDGKVIEVK
jgi:aminopeptidase N